MLNTKNNYDFVIIGAGIMGLTIAYRLLRQQSQLKILVIEKETMPAIHASGRNSGVLHAGIYYGNDSQKARFCLEGNKQMKSFCRDNQIFINNCGKLIVAQNESQLEELNRLYHSGRRNGAALQLLDEQQAKEIEPSVKTYQKAIWSPDTASVNPQAVIEKLMQRLSQFKNITFAFGTAVSSIQSTEKMIVTYNGEKFHYGHLFNCAGLYADKLAKGSIEEASRYQILPFKGIYLSGEDERVMRLRTNIYPVPDPRYPFLGVHFTITAEGKTKLGPTALPAFWRENYKGLQRFSMAEMGEITQWYLRSFIRNDFSFRNLVRQEMRNIFKGYIVSQGSRLVDTTIPTAKMKYLKAGLRAQLFDKQSKTLVNDFIFINKNHMCHILNAVSPGFTCSFSIADYLTREVVAV